VQTVDVGAGRDFEFEPAFPLTDTHETARFVIDAAGTAVSVLNEDHDGTLRSRQ
jgi:hypothetical protein